MKHNEKRVNEKYLEALQAAKYFIDLLISQRCGDAHDGGEQGLWDEICYTLGIYDDCVPAGRGWTWQMLNDLLREKWGVPDDWGMTDRKYRSHGPRMKPKRLFDKLAEIIEYETH